MKKNRLHRGQKRSAVAPPTRDSNARIGPSSVVVGVPSRSTPADLASDQQSAIRSINDYLASHSIPVLLQPHSLPSSKDVALLLNSILSHLDYPNPNLVDDLPALLKSLKCPFKLSKSSIRTPNTPHTWPHVILVIHWLVQLSSYLQRLVVAADASRVARNERENDINAYLRKSYLHFIRGEDDAVEELDRELKERLERERDAYREGVAALQKEARELESRVEGMRTEVSLTEVKEEERKVLEDDVRRFDALIGEIKDRMDRVQKGLKEKDEVLRVKEEEKRRIDEENHELRKLVNAQTVTVRDVARMKRELSALEREIDDAESERNRVEDKCWEVELVIRRKFMELEETANECNKAIRKFVPFPFVNFLLITRL